MNGTPRSRSLTVVLQSGGRLTVTTPDAPGLLTQMAAAIARRDDLVIVYEGPPGDLVGRQERMVIRTADIAAVALAD